LQVILPGFTLERREDGPLLQLARLALIVAPPGRYGGRGDGSRADAAVARRAKERQAAPRRVTFPGRPAW
jgi:hypothetical protein